MGNLIESLKISSAKSQFDANAGRYAISSVHRFGPSLPVLLNLADPNKNDLVLDIATGTGNTALAFAPFVARVTGIDMSPKMLEQAKTRKDTEQIQNAEFLEGDAENLPFPDSSFTIVTSRHAPHHFHDVPKFLSEVARVLKPHGRFVMSDQIVIHKEDQDWVNEFQRTRDPSHFLQRLVTSGKNSCTMQFWSGSKINSCRTSSSLIGGLRWAVVKSAKFRGLNAWHLKQNKAVEAG